MKNPIYVGLDNVL